MKREKYRDLDSSPIIIDRIQPRSTTTGKRVLDVFMEPLPHAVFSVFESDYGRLMAAGIPVNEILATGDTYYCQILAEWEYADKEKKSGNKYKQLVSASSMVDNGNAALVKRLDRMGTLIAEQNQFLKQLLLVVNGGDLTAVAPKPANGSQAAPVRNGATNGTTAVAPPTNGSPTAQQTAVATPPEPRTTAVDETPKAIDYWRIEAEQAKDEFLFDTAVASCFREQIEPLAKAFGLGGASDAAKAFRNKYLDGRNAIDGFRFFEEYFSDEGWQKAEHPKRLRMAQDAIAESVPY